MTINPVIISAAHSLSSHLNNSSRYDSMTEHPIPTKPEKIQRLNYIGSKFQLLEWIDQTIREKTGWADFRGKVVADLFAGTGVVSHYLRNKGAITLTNDAELYSSIISYALSISVYTANLARWIETLNSELEAKQYANTVGFITSQYSPFGEKGRMFFIVDNARRIDYLRGRLEILAHDDLDIDEYKFLLASLILSADAVSNVPAVYGCYLKNFKAKAEKALVLTAIHQNRMPPVLTSRCFQCDVLSGDFLDATLPRLDLAYLDPPYNERQYSKNYFPLNMIALSPQQQALEKPLTGKTGIPADCFTSPFCKKREVEDAFRQMIGHLRAEWIVLSYSSEALVPKTRLVEILGEFGQVSVVERQHKRFKSFEYNESGTTSEYLFILQKNNM